jgi:hypothetical protein
VGWNAAKDEISSFVFGAQAHDSMNVPVGLETTHAGELPESHPDESC